MRGEYSLSDIAAVSRNTNNDGFGGAGCWWIIIIIILFGWGNNGFGYGFGGGRGSDSGSAANYTLASDFATIQRQLSDGFGGVEKGLDTIRNGLCDGFYTNAQLINGVNTNILTTGNNITSQLAEVGFGIKDCCCQQLRAIDSVNFNASQNACAITNAINTGLNNVMQNCNNNYRQLHDELINFRIQDKDTQIANQQNEINALRLAASQCAQNQYLVEKLQFPKPPVAAYAVPNPYCNCGNGCGCNC